MFGNWVYVCEAILLFVLLLLKSDFTNSTTGGRSPATARLYGSSLVSSFCIHGAWMMVIRSDRSLLARGIVRKLNCLEMTTLLPQQTLSCHSPFGLN